MNRRQLLIYFNRNGIKLKRNSHYDIYSSEISGIDYVQFILSKREIILLLSSKKVLSDLEKKLRKIHDELVMEGINLSVYNQRKLAIKRIRT
mgnify:CR=1 FL=1